MKNPCGLDYLLGTLGAMSAIGDRIAESRIAKRWRMPRLGQEAGISRSSLSDYESGKADPQKVTVGETAAALGVPVDWLLGKTDDHPHTYTGTRRGLHRVEGQSPRFTGHDTPHPEAWAELPLMTEIPAGPPIDVEEVPERHPVLKHLPGPNRYILRVLGDSVLLNGDATLKRVYFERKNGKRMVVLRGDNPAIKPKIVDETDDFQVTGVVLCLVERWED